MEGKYHSDDEMAKVNKIQANIDIEVGSHISRECNGNKNENDAGLFFFHLVAATSEGRH